MEPRRRRMRLTYKQLKLLVKFMGDNPQVAKGVDYRTAFGKHYHDAKWSELANLMNAQENGMKKSPRDWNRYWKDLKSGIKKKVHSREMKPSRRKTPLTSIEQIIYNEMCKNKNWKAIDMVEKTHSHLHVPLESDTEQDNYEVEYLEDSSCDETQLTGIPDMETVAEFVGIKNNRTLNALESELHDYSVSSVEEDHMHEEFTEKWPLNEATPAGTVASSVLACNTVKPETLSDKDHFVTDTIFNEPKPKQETEDPLEPAVTKNDINTNTITNGDLNLYANVETNAGLLSDIRTHLKALVDVQKDRATSAYRLAAAHERRAILEERRVKLEERRLKLEERKLTLKERKIEALEKRSFAEDG